MSIKKILSLFLVGVFQSEARQNYFISNGKDEVATASDGIERIQGRKKIEFKQQYAEAIYLIEAVNKPMAPEISCIKPFQRTAQAMVFISVWLTLVVNKYFAVSQCAHACQIENLAETNFVEIFGRAKQILSVQCVRTLSQVRC